MHQETGNMYSTYHVVMSMVQCTVHVSETEQYVQQYSMCCDVTRLILRAYYTEGVFTSSGGTGCIYSKHFYVQPSVSHQLSFHTKTRTISYMHIFLIFGRLYHIYSETDMHIFSCFGRLNHINSQIFVYAFAPGRVYINAFC